MTHNKLTTSLLAACLATLLPLATQSAHAATANAPAQAMPSDMPMHGSQLMTDHERTILRARMWAAKSDEERQRIHVAHHEEMKKRAQAKGVPLPDMPPEMPGVGMHRGAGMAAHCGASAPSCAAPGSRPGRGAHQGAGQMSGH